MNAGVIGLVEGDFQAVDSFSDTVVEGDRELTRTLDVGRVFSLPSGDIAFEGRAAVERTAERATAELDYGEVRLRETNETETRVTGFVGVPGEFVVTESGAGRFAFDLIARDTGTDVERATFDLDGFLDAHADADVWKAGFSGADGSAESGLFHGSDLLADDDLAHLVRRGDLNQLGLEYGYDEDDLKMTAAKSGYVEVYRPAAFDSADFLAYLLDEVVPHLERSD
ncbi:hypothetical protein [Halomicrococcus gelatinilyticus]|uniref:hypothetical protein n=1 Tax=Halomicrococcus gelatinilyticus TaxID=1702103 RepID=UPI002E0ED5DA